jgi:hypothetical protein
VKTIKTNMTDKKILEQLKGLKSVRLSEETKKENKSVLLSQISNTSVKKEVPSNNNIFNFKNVFSLMYRPVLVVAGIFVFLSGALIVGGGFYDRLKPNDSLYIARIISEKARLNTTFDQEDRELLLARFASSHARDIANILMDSEFNTEENQDRVEELNYSFQNEISKVRDSVEKDYQESEEKRLEEEKVISASSLREDNGIEINISEEEEEEIEEDSKTEEDSLATSSEEEIVEEKIEKNIEKINETENGSRLIEEIESLFAEKRFEEVVEKLDEVDEIIER